MRPPRSITRLALLGAAAFTMVAQIAQEAAAEPAPIEVRRVTATSAWSRPSPDPMGLAWDPSTRRLLVVDSEVEETRLWEGVNLFRSRLKGRLTGGVSLLGLTNEPTDIDRGPGGRYFIATDSPDRVFEIFVGRDGRPFSGDEHVRTIDLHHFGFEGQRATDVEGLAFGGRTLWLADEARAEIYRVRPGPDGRWSGRGQRDNVVTHWDTAALGQPAPEGVEYVESTKTLLIVSNRNDSDIVQVTQRGRLVATFDGSLVDSHSPSGLRLGPPTSGTGRSLYMTDRGVDNDRRPNENDGRLFELHLDL